MEANLDLPFPAISLKGEGKNFEEFMVVLSDGLSHFYSFLSFFPSENCTLFMAAPFGRP